MGNMENEFDLYSFNKSFSDEIQLSYKGPFESSVLSVIGNYIVDIIGKKSEASQKLFKIFIELAENISQYSEEKNMLDSRTGIGILIIREHDKHYSFHTGNKVLKKEVIPILEKAEIINSLDREGLREFKRKQRNLPRGERGNANVGLIQIALTSNNPLGIKSTDIDDDYAFLAIKVKIDK